MFDSSAVGVHKRIHDSLIDCIGMTPTIRLSRLSQKLSATKAPVAKWEGSNPGGSSKDRAAYAMIKSLMDQRLIHPDSHLIEATSGNSGISLAWISAILQIPVTIVMPDNMSLERRKLIRHFGAQLVLSPAVHGMPGAIALAKKLAQGDKRYVCLDQFSNSANKHAHFNTTAQELLDSCGHQLDVVIVSVGTGGTIAGLAQALKQFRPSIEVVAVQPSTGEKIPGIGVEGPLPLIDSSLIHNTVRVSLEDALESARLLAVTEGIAGGISSGAVISAWQMIQRESPNAQCAVLLADSAERYFSSDLFAPLS